MEDPLTGERAQKADWFVLACVIVLCLTTVVDLAWLLWKYVPLHAASLADPARPLPTPARIAVGSSHWFVRLLPLEVVTVLFGVVLGGVAFAIAWQSVGSRRAVAWLTSAGLVVSLLGALGCAFLVVAIESAVEAALLGEIR